VTRGLVSVVMAAFDEETFIGEAIASALAQSYTPIEVIVVDDGSTDRTVEIAEQHGVTVLRQPHRGPAAARNAGLRAARGEYWTIFDGDDLMPPERIERQVAHLEQHPEHGIVLGLTEAFVTPGQPRPTHFKPSWDHGPFPGHLGTTLGRRAVLELVGPFNENLQLGEDADWQARATEAGVSAGQIDRLCLRYRVHDANTSSDTRANRQATLRVLRESVRRRRSAIGDD
jgi:glycosyltransferase involved in cell wall biosynthesis